ncbi:hypothetical protein DV532_27115 (plasmid) [Pseudomonas sp. Leaf58]|uniref:hypothetical protein n=1 Tax=Pseudomonas sp. Leaf58 TaxID=1736226 RepID=UPI0006F5D994|nr:hypothetical protein [Pseudomonas sp. Leaf58]AYG47954.1 hypothetical protein DV532_27115 [Pseudomonas sp. Leaf58]KQN62484.1 hypothetical protein ASF02_10060 [Pseudomonas sp. Leaf58]
MKNPIFGTSLPIELKPERVQVVSQFADEALELAMAHDQQFTTLAEMAEENGYWDEAHLDEFIKSQHGLKLLSHFFERGVLDIATLIVADKVEDIDDFWGNFATFELEELRKDLMQYGLHGLHFRSNMPTQDHRLAAVKLLSQRLFDLQSEAYTTDPCFPLGALSCLIKLDYEKEFQHARQVEEGAELADDIPRANRHHLNALLGLGLETTEGKPWSLKRAVDYFLSYEGQYDYPTLKDTLKPQKLANMIQLGFRCLVYNRGYQLKAAQGCARMTDFELMRAVEPTIDRLLTPFKASPEFNQALKRQVLINLFSAFPSGLALLDAQPEELQGVILDPVLRSHPDARYFATTLAGPTHLFAANRSAPKQHKATQVAEFLQAAGYPIHIDIACKGWLSTLGQTGNLIDHAEGKSDVLDAFFSESRTLDDTPFGTALSLLTPEYLAHYSDSAVINLIKAGAQISCPEAGYLTYRRACAAIDLRDFFAARADMIPVVLSALEKDDLISIHAFKLCGFGRRELTLLDNPPGSLNEHILGGDLGL